MTRENFACIKGALCGIAVAMIIAAITHCKASKKRRMRRAAFKAVRGLSGIVSGIRDIF